MPADNTAPETAVFGEPFPRHAKGLRGADLTNPDREVKTRRRRYAVHTVPATPADPQPVRQLRAAFTAAQLSFAEFTGRLARYDADPDHADVTSDLPALPAPDWSTVSRPTLRYLDRSVLATLARITDPKVRCEHAAAAAVRAEAVMDEARLNRTRALVSLHVRFSIPFAGCYTPYGILRKTFRDAVASFPGAPPQFESIDAAWAEADKWHAKYEPARATAETARMVRDFEIRQLTGGGYGPKMDNVEVADLLGTSTARIAQIRKTKPAALAA